MARLGVGGPGLSNTTFAHGVATLRQTMEDNLTATLDFKRAQNNKTFTDVHGDALALKMHRLCDVIDDADLPEVHTLLLKAGKGRAYGILNSMFAERAQASAVPLTLATAPIATTKMVEEVFRNYMPGGDGLTFAKGLSPFAAVCEGHDGIAQVHSLVQRAQLVETGASVSLADATALTSDDVRFPTQPYVAVEKLYAWSVIVDVFHGVRHPVAIAISEAVRLIGPLLQRMAGHMGDTPGAGMELICRVMYDMQQDYYQYLSNVAAAVPGAPPNFAAVIKLVQTYRAESLAPLPAHWYQIIDCPRSRAPAKANPSPASNVPRASSSNTTVVNAHADKRLTERYKASGHANITAMIGGKDVEIPKHAGKPVCLSWALKGACSTGCKRADTHARYNRSVNQELHGLMDSCGVANSQP